MTNPSTFNMQRGPAIPWELAEIIYHGYCILYPSSAQQQSLEMLHKRGGFSWSEVERIFEELPRSSRDALLEQARRQ